MSDPRDDLAALIEQHYHWTDDADDPSIGH
jgi:hypothetical protein